MGFWHSLGVGEALMNSGNTRYSPLCRIASFLFVFLVSGFAAAQSPTETASPAMPEVSDAERHIEVTAEYPSGETLRVSEPFVFEIAVRWSGAGETISTRLAEAPSFENLDVLSTSTRSASRPDGEIRRMEEVYSFRLVPLDEGPARVGGTEVIYGSGDEELGRLSTLPVDMHIEPPGRSPDFAIPIVSALVVVIAVLATILVKRRKKKRAVDRADAESEPAESREEDLLAEARKCRMEGDTTRYYACLQEAVSEQLGNRYLYGASRLRSASELPESIDSETRQTVRSFFSRCEEAKHAPGSPTREELDRIWDDAQHLLRE